MHCNIFNLKLNGYTRLKSLIRMLTCQNTLKSLKAFNRQMQSRFFFYGRKWFSYQCMILVLNKIGNLNTFSKDVMETSFVQHYTILTIETRTIWSIYCLGLQISTSTCAYKLVFCLSIRTCSWIADCIGL